MQHAPNKLLDALYARRAYTHMADLQTATGLSARGVAQALAALRQRGHEIDESPTRGVRLGRPVAMDAHLIEQGLGTRRIGRDVIVFPEVVSTNDVAFDSARQTDADGLVVLAESQRGGRGRLGRRWVSPPGKNVLMSVLLIDEPQRLSNEALTIATGLAVAEGVEAFAGLGCQLKWPNDVLLEGAKLCGVLVEVRAVPRQSAVARGRTAATARCIVVGIGINANVAPPPEAITRPATSLAAHLGHEVERIELVRAVLRRLDHWAAAIAAGATDLHDAWLARCAMTNQRLTVLHAGERFTGRVLDIHPFQGLVLQTDAGQQVLLPAATSTIE